MNPHFNFQCVNLKQNKQKPSNPQTPKPSIKPKINAHPFWMKGPHCAITEFFTLYDVCITYSVES